MKKILIMTLALCLCVGWVGLAKAASPDDAKALVKSALKMAKEKGLDATLKAIADPKGPFVKGDLYIFAGDTKNTQLVAHPIKPKLVGKDLSKIKDIKGKLFFMGFVQTAQNKGSGWVDYYWPKPGSKKPVPKTTYVEIVPGTNIYFACGIYK